jgi:uncharacterized protein (DUF3084 family)
MSWQNVLALAVFVIVCGIIAYVGDILGRRMGKRRLTLFGLRPRHTAIVMTTITGMLIAIFTIAIMATLSKEVQQLVLRGAEVLQDLRTTQKAYSRATRELSAQKRIVQLARSQAVSAVQERNRLAAELDVIDRSLAKLTADLRHNEQALHTAEKRLSTTKGDLTAAKLEIAKRRAEITRQKAGIKSFRDYRTRIMDEFAPLYKGLRERRIIFRPDEEIARKVIVSAQTKRKIKNDVLALLDEADKRARAEGAKIGDNNRAVGILPYEVGRLLEESVNIDLVTDKIFSGSGSVVLIVVSVGNAAEGEQTLVDFKPYYNRLVYSSGDEVAGTLLDGGASRGQIFNNVVVFLRNEVRSAAIGKGVIPAFDEEGRPSVGQIAGDQLFDLVDRIKATGKLVRITARASREIWSADSLELSFDVSEPK